MPTTHNRSCGRPSKPLIGPGHIQERLNSAAVLLVLLDPRMAFPSDPDAQTLFDRSIKRLTSSQPTGDEGTIEATTRTLSDDEGGRLAEDIFPPVLPCNGVDGYTSLVFEHDQIGIVQIPQDIETLTM